MPFPKTSKDISISGASKPAPDAVNQPQTKEKKTKQGVRK